MKFRSFGDSTSSRVKDTLKTIRLCIRLCIIFEVWPIRFHLYSNTQVTAIKLTYSEMRNKFSSMDSHIILQLVHKQFIHYMQSCYTPDTHTSVIHINQSIFTQ